VAIDLVIMLGLIAWLLVKPSKPALIATGVLEGLATAYNVSVLIGQPFGSTDHKALTMHILLRLAALGLVALAWVSLFIWGLSPYARFLKHDALEGLKLQDSPPVLAIMVAGWTLMLVAMMLPTTLPLLTLFYGLAARRYHRVRLLVLVVPFIATSAVATGGLESPVLQLILPLTFFVAMFNPLGRVVAFAGGLVAMLWCLAALTLSGALVDLVPRLFGGGPRAGHNDVLLITYVTATTLMVAWGQSQKAG
jgi:hypothetical protein